MKTLREFGLRASGTRWLREIVETNLDPVQVTRHTPHWTHGPFAPDPDADGYLCLAKHPHAWLASVQHHYEDREHGFTPHPYQLADKWATTTATYVQAQRHRDDVQLFRYVDVLEHLEDALDAIANSFYLETAETLDAPSRDTLPAGATHEDLGLTDPADEHPHWIGLAWYKHGWWTRVLEPLEVARFNAALDYTTTDPHTLDPAQALDYHVPRADQLDNDPHPYT